MNSSARIRRILILLLLPSLLAPAWASGVLQSTGQPAPLFALEKTALPKGTRPLLPNTTEEFHIQVEPASVAANPPSFLIDLPGHAFVVTDSQGRTAVASSTASPTTVAKEAQIVSQGVPTTMVAGQQYVVSVTVKNIGSLTWSPIGPQCNAYRLAQVGSAAWNPIRTELPAPLSTGGQVTLNYNVVAPATPGSYNFQVQMVRECVEFFPDLGPNVVVNVQPPPIKKALFVAQNVPSTMVAGQSYLVSLTIQNVGNVTWSPIGPQCNAYRLGSANSNNWGVWGGRVELPAAVAPGQQVTLNFTVIAPSTPGDYYFQWQMVHECVEWFNDPSQPNFTVTVTAPPSAADQTCDQGAAINASAAVSVYWDDLNLNLADYGIIFQDASQATNAAAWDSARDALIRKIDNTIAAGSHYNAVTNKTGGPYQGWLEGANVSLIMASGLLLADHGRLTRPLDSAIRRVIGSYVFNRDVGCGFSDGRWWGQNNCMDDYAVAATGYAWIAAYKYKRGDRDVSNYADAAKNAISLALGLEESVCAYRTGSAWSPSSSRGPCTATVDDLKNEQAEVISLNHGQQTIAYGLGLMTNISSAFIGLQTANSAPVLTADQEEVAKALFREGQSRTIAGGDTFDPHGCYTFTADRTAFQPLRVHCGDVDGNYKPKMFPVKSFYTEVLHLTPPSAGFQFDVFDPTLFQDSGFFSRGRQVVFGDLTKCWYPETSRPALGGMPVAPPLADVVWVKPSYVTSGAPNTLTVAGYARNGSGGVQLRWRDVTTGGPEQVESYQPLPAADGSWSNTLPSASHCHDYEVYVNYAGSTSNTFLYSGLGSGYCPESGRITWIQPQWSAGTGSSGSLVVLGSAANDPAGSAVKLYWRDLSVHPPTPWNLVSFAAPVAADGAWYNTIPNVNYSHVYEVYAKYDAFASRLCRYNGNQLPNWCEVNYAAPSAGAAVSASSTYSAGYPVSAVNNGDRKGLNWGAGGGWNDATADAYPDWVQVDFYGIKTIDQVNVFTLQDNIGNPVEPVEALTFSAYGLTNLGVDYWDDAAGTWKPVPRAVVAGNNKVWTRFLFSPLATSKIRVTVTGALFSYSRITEVEAWGVPPAKSNYASAAQGATATASSTFSSGYPAAAVTDGDRKGLNWGAGGGWNDATAEVYPDWVEVHFKDAVARPIDEINVFTLQDNYGNPADPTQTMTFSAYGITAFEVQYLDGSTWVTVPGGSVTGNNNVWRRFSFSPVTTTGIRVLVNNALSGYSRITEIEALGW